MDKQNDRPIAMGLVILMTEEGDSITSTATDELGGFSVSSADPGNFVLLASALGYLDGWGGVFELGEGGEITVEFRVAPQPLPVDALTVSVAPKGLSLDVIRSGFIQRLQRGLGHFITPFDLANSNAVRMTDLFLHIPGVSVQSGGFTGEKILLRSAGSLCEPRIYLDGLRINVGQPGDLNAIVPIDGLEAAEIYSRSTQIPPEYALGGYGAGAPGSSLEGPCGVILLWTKG